LLSLCPQSRGALETKTLQEMANTNVANMEDGVNAWKEMGYETE
jgi:rhodanese-related sulfurtransferase